MMDPSPTFSTSESLAQSARVEALNKRYESTSAQEIIRAACVEMFFDRIAVVSSFGAEAAVLLHMISHISSATPVIFLDTGKHYQQTIDYVRRLVSELGLGVLVTAYPSKHQLASDDPKGDLHVRNPDMCCHIRKTLPLLRALRPYDAFFTGRKRFQTETRSAMTPFEAFGRWIRINPLWNWNAGEIRVYFDRYGLPSHPLTEDGYLSIGCEPCTRPVKKGESTRAGRWADSDKTECGIHLTSDGQIKRTRRK